jgi:hypothetical protein
MTTTPTGGTGTVTSPPPPRAARKAPAASTSRRAPVLHGEGPQPGGHHEGRRRALLVHGFVKLSKLPFGLNANGQADLKLIHYVRLTGRLSRRDNMAIVFDGPVTPDALTTFVREVPTPANQVLNQLLPDRYFNDNTIDFAELTRTNRTARFRAFDGRLHVSERDSNITKQVKLPPLSSSLSMGELERLQIQFARTAAPTTPRSSTRSTTTPEPDPGGPDPHGAGPR